MKSVLTKHQTKTFGPKTYMENGIKYRITANVRYDDQCGNGHNSFSITGDIDRHNGIRWIEDAGGCIHNEIGKHFPELKPFIKWHLTSSDGPMHYVANTMYHARDCDRDGLRPGDAYQFFTRLKFDGIPFTFKEHEKGFWAYLAEVGDFNNINVEPVPYDGKDAYNFAPNYSLTGFIKENELKQWYRAPFKSKREATEFLNALQNSGYEFIKTPTAWAKEVTPNLEFARSSAIWPDATLEQLRDKDLLEARLPKLMADFESAMIKLGFVF